MGFAKFLFFKLLGWKILGSFSPEIKKAIVIVAPHTSWHDFYIGAFARKILKIQINYVAKKELFRPPFGWYFKWMGGSPLDRDSRQNTVDLMVELFSGKEEFRLALSPEGTRKKVEQWKTGFYYIALKANVPIICVSFDYKAKIITIGKPYFLTGDITKDFDVFHSFFKNVEGKKKENFSHKFI